MPIFYITILKVRVDHKNGFHKCNHSNHLSRFHNNHKNHKNDY